MGTENKSDNRLTELAIVWGIAGLGGILACVVIFNFANIGITGAVFIAAVLTVVVGLFLTRAMTGPLSPPTSVTGPASAPAAPAATPAPAPEPEAEPAPAAKAEPAPASEPAPAAPDDGRPKGLDAAREGGPDDLKAIKGVGPKLEALLHSMGYYHFDQIAAWTDQEIAWVDENLEGFKGRVTRDNWVAQAKELSKG